MKITSIEEYLDEYIKIWPFSGNVGVIRHGNIIFKHSYGMACHEYRIQNTIDTCFTLGSISKQFTAFVVMLLNEQGKIDIYKPINDYLPKELMIDNRITAHNLMSHTSGLHQFYNWEEDFFQIYDRGTFNRLDFFQKYINRPLGFEPGAKFEYNNANYNMLAWAIENICNKSFEHVLHEMIFLPLEMNNTVLDDGHNIVKNRAFPYQIDRNDIVRCQYYNEKFSIGAGAVMSNFHDLCKWYRCLKDRKLLSNETYDKFFTENLAGYCYGINRDNIYGRTRFSHGGDHLGVMTYVQYFFEDDICVIILSNLECGNNYHIGNAITEIFFNGSTEKPKRFEKIQLGKEELSKYEGIYLENKIEIQQVGEGVEFMRFNGEVHHLLYPVSDNKFAKVWVDQDKPYTITEDEDGSYEFFGYKKSK
ncbi:serine hydrolase domain-containing protein [Clostridium frigidicarnis]|uniref:CubicO group peptidase, beta-lactamase class C family n=1 Tax=Clostridium frigidicarnis TaxID=84698 RepID=A0A1I0YDE8_9CLOT|nr:serine hydrolase domain-containing protein [Clostridium frigidicarnis]SFB11172.1 CubicO group peptidase, beta-lactamase class C family [Clostridium frigidicarnis]